MGKIWVLDTGTKGTGAEMVPLEKVLKSPGPTAAPAIVPSKRGPQPAEPPEPRQPPRFKVVDVMTRKVFADGASARATVDLLEGVRSIVDVTIYVWESRTEKWRMLSYRDQKLLWRLRGQAGRERAALPLPGRGRHRYDRVSGARPRRPG